MFEKFMPEEPMEPDLNDEIEKGEKEAEDAIEEAEDELRDATEEEIEAADKEEEEEEMKKEEEEEFADAKIPEFEPEPKEIVKGIVPEEKTPPSPLEDESKESFIHRYMNHPVVLRKIGRQYRNAAAEAAWKQHLGV
ncbi:MAG: hypothetical protein ACW96U_00965 [Candidatus Heimdallarchaeaceae archaeon]|jgi:type I site-specific restriction-modification system R (restriction) subunit